jgi:hypothetical protein
MTKNMAGVAALSALLLGIVTILVFWNGSGSRRVIPAAIGQPGNESENGAGKPGHVTHHPILVQPKESTGADGIDSFSPATGGTRPTASTENDRGSVRPDSDYPRTSFLPTPEQLDIGPSANDAIEPNHWPDGRPLEVPGRDWGTGPTWKHPVPLDLQEPSPQWEQWQQPTEPPEPDSLDDRRADPERPGSM